MCQYYHKKLGMFPLLLCCLKNTRIHRKTSMCHTSGVVFLDNIDVSCNMKRALDKMGVHYEMEGCTM